MKTSIALVLLALCASAPSHASLSASAATLSPASPEAVALGLINDAASDSWAEGGDVENLDFTDLQCDLSASKCTLQYEVNHYVYQHRSLRAGGAISGYGDLLDILKYGFVLKTGVTSQIDTCMTAAGI